MFHFSSLVKPKKNGKNSFPEKCFPQTEHPLSSSIIDFIACYLCYFQIQCLVLPHLFPTNSLSIANTIPSKFHTSSRELPLSLILPPIWIKMLDHFILSFLGGHSHVSPSRIITKSSPLLSFPSSSNPTILFQTTSKSRE